MPYSCLIEDLEYAFCGQIKARLKILDTMTDEERRKEEDKEFLTHWKMRSVFDERDLGERYWEGEMDRRTGKTAEKEVETLVKANKKVEEKKIDRGFDIMRTWDIKNIMNDLWWVKSFKSWVDKNTNTFYFTNKILQFLNLNK